MDYPSICEGVDYRKEETKFHSIDFPNNPIPEISEFSYYSAPTMTLKGKDYRWKSNMLIECIDIKA